MRMLQGASVLLSSGIAVAAAWDIGNLNDRYACQSLHHGRSPLDGCDAQRTLYVNAAGNTTYKTVQSAVLALPNNTGRYN